MTWSLINFFRQKKLEPLLIENENFEHVKFELVNNYLTHGSIIGIDVHVHYNNDAHVEFHYVPSCNDQNNAFNKGPIDIYTLEVYNPKSCIYSQLQGYYQLESYKKSTSSLVLLLRYCLFLFATRGHE